jgi:hypothetical protein
MTKSYSRQSKSAGLQVNWELMSECYLIQFHTGPWHSPSPWHKVFAFSQFITVCLQISF